MFGPEIVVQYRQYNESYCPSAPIKTADAAISLRKLVALDIIFIPLGEQQFDEGNITSHRSWHAAPLLVLLSDDIERLHPDVVRTLHAGYQSKFLLLVEVSDLKKYPSVRVGPGAYTPEEVKWCDTTYDFLVSQMGDEARIKRCLPRRRAGRTGGRAAAAAPAAAAPAPALPPPAAAAAGNNDTENEDDIPLRQPKNHKRRRTSR
jgi:hypothetical protein